MKIAYMPFSPQFIIYAYNLIKRLSLEHEMKFFTTHKLPTTDDGSMLEGLNISYEPWSWFDLKDVWDFAPDLIIMWNGYAPWTYAAMQWLKQRYPVLHMERAWLPQNGNFYIADDLAAHSKFIMDMPKTVAVDEQKISELKRLYRPRYTDSHLPEKFIFIPGQLDQDTSITISSPLFKTCDSMIGALRHYIPDVPIIVKNHPLDEGKPRSSEATLYKGPLSSMDLAAQATVVVGLTSTVLTEALIYEKPVVSFGHNVGMTSHLQGIDCQEELFSRIREVYTDPSKFSPPRPPKETLSWLLSKQWSGTAVPEWVIEYIEGATSL